MCSNTLIYVVPCVLKMSYPEFLNELLRAGLSVRAFAELIGMNPNSISNYARDGALPTHLALIAVLVAELSDQGFDYRQVIAKVELVPKSRAEQRAGVTLAETGRTA
jgi:transcriptional regulator with XRE-family HTH domain